jgi:hypothetical protein
MWQKCPSQPNKNITPKQGAIFISGGQCKGIHNRSFYSLAYDLFYYIPIVSPL